MKSHFIKCSLLHTYCLFSKWRRREKLRNQHWQLIIDNMKKQNKPTTYIYIICSVVCDWLLLDCCLGLITLHSLSGTDYSPTVVWDWLLSACLGLITLRQSGTDYTPPVLDILLSACLVLVTLCLLSGTDNSPPVVLDWILFACCGGWLLFFCLGLITLRLLSGTDYSLPVVWDWLLSACSPRLVTLRLFLSMERL